MRPMNSLILRKLFSVYFCLVACSGQEVASDPIGRGMLTASDTRAGVDVVYTVTANDVLSPNIDAFTGEPMLEENIHKSNFRSVAGDYYILVGVDADVSENLNVLGTAELPFIHYFAYNIELEAESGITATTTVTTTTLTAKNATDKK